MIRVLFLIISGCVLAILTNEMISSLIVSLWGESVLENHTVSGFSHAKILLVGLLIAPVLETALFQLLPIRVIVYFKFKYNNVVAIVVSSLVFASTHYYSEAYLVISFSLGLIFSSFFYYGYVRHRMGYIVAAVIHFASNAYVLLW